MKSLDPFTAINMACIAYLDQVDAPPQRFAVETALAAIPGGQGWTLAGGWGPVRTGDLQAFVAVNSDQSVYAVAIRSMANLFEPAVFARWLLSLDIAQTDWLYPRGTGARIARNTSAEFNQLIQALEPSTQLTLLQYLAGEMSRKPGVALMVAGHGQGGCLSLAVAAYLRDQLKPAPRITTYTFGAPTAGNQPFAQLCNALDGQRFANAGDIVPKAFAQLVGGSNGDVALTAMYPAGGPKFKDVFAKGTQHLEFVSLAAAVQMLYAQSGFRRAGSVTDPGIINFSSPPWVGARNFLQAAAHEHDRSLYFDYVAGQTDHPGAVAPS